MEKGVFECWTGCWLSHCGFLAQAEEAEGGATSTCHLEDSISPPSTQLGSCLTDPSQREKKGSEQWNNSLDLPFSFLNSQPLFQAPEMACHAMPRAMCKGTKTIQCSQAHPSQTLPLPFLSFCVPLKVYLVGLDSLVAFD